MRIRKPWAVLVLACAVTGCGSEVTGIPLGDLGGIWLSTSYVFTDNADPQRSRDLQAEDGALLTLTIDNGQTPPTVGALFDDGLGSGFNTTGLVDITAAHITIGAGVFDAVHDGNRLTLTNSITVYSFPGSATTNTTLTVELMRL